MALGSSFLLAAPLSASASSTTVTTGSYAQGQFLGGTIAGMDLDKLLAFKSAEARNDGSTTSKEAKDPMTASILQAIKIDPPGGMQYNLGDVINAGVMHQYASAKNSGVSRGASGAISNDGGIGVGDIDPYSGGNLALALNPLLADRFAGVISDLSLQVKAVGAQADGSTSAVSGDYSLAGLTLKFTSPALANLNGKVATALAPTSGSLAGLTGPTGSLTAAVSKVLASINPVLAVTGSSATATATVTADVQAAVQPILQGTYTSPGITIDLKTGTVTADLEKLLGGSLNNLAPGTEILSDSVVNAILTAVTSQMASIADQVKNKADLALRNARVDVDVTVTALSTAAGSPAVPGIPAIPGVPAIPAVPAVVCSVLDLLHLCKPSAGSAGSPAIPGIPAVPGIGAVIGGKLASTADVHINGTVSQILGGTADQAVASVSLLGGTIPITLSAKSVLGSLGATLQDKLFDNDSAISQLVGSLNTSVVAPAVTALLGPAGATVSDVLAGILSVKVNLKEVTLNSTQGMAVPTGSTFTETAMRVAVLKDVGSSGLATLNLAQATVGPRMSIITDPGDPGTPTTPPGTNPPGTGDNPGGTGSNTAASHASNLAFTGIGIATIVLVILALLAAGAYLVRVGYRRTHPRGLS